MAENGGVPLCCSLIMSCPLYDRPPDPCPTYDWILVGGGLTGSALAYELACQGQQVILVEPHISPGGSTRYSYGGIAHWSATDALTRYWADRSRDRYRALEAELTTDLHLRETHLLLTVAPGAGMEAALAAYGGLAVAPQGLTVAEAVEREPLLRRESLGGALLFPHGQVCPLGLLAGYQEGLGQGGGAIAGMPCTGLRWENRGSQRYLVGVDTPHGPIAGKRVVLCAGGWGRSLLREWGFPLPLYYTQAEVVEISAPAGSVRGLIMPADNQRFALEAQASQPDRDYLWDQPHQELVPASLDVGAVQFASQRVLLGQLSRTWSDLVPPIEPQAGEQAIRQGIRELMPTLADRPGTWHQCTVAFSRDGLPWVGEVAPGTGLYAFTGFTSPFLFAPPLAQAFAQALAQEATQGSAPAFTQDVTENPASLRSFSPQRFLSPVVEG